MGIDFKVRLGPYTWQILTETLVGQGLTLYLLETHILRHLIYFEKFNWKYHTPLNLEFHYGLIQWVIFNKMGVIFAHSDVGISIEIHSSWWINPSPTKLPYLNIHPLEDVSPYRDRNFKWVKNTYIRLLWDLQQKPTISDGMRMINVTT